MTAGCSSMQPQVIESRIKCCLSQVNQDGSPATILNDVKSLRELSPVLLIPKSTVWGADWGLGI